MMRKLAAAPVLALAIGVLAPMQCATEPVRSGPTYHPPICNVNGAKTGYSCRFSRQWQIDADGQTLVNSLVWCHGSATTVRRGAEQNISNKSAELTITAFCPSTAPRDANGSQIAGGSSSTRHP